MPRRTPCRVAGGDLPLAEPRLLEEARDDIALSSRFPREHRQSAPLFPPRRTAGWRRSEVHRPCLLLAPLRKDSIPSSYRDLCWSCTDDRLVEDAELRSSIMVESSALPTFSVTSLLTSDDTHPLTHDPMAPGGGGLDGSLSCQIRLTGLRREQGERVVQVLLSLDALYLVETGIDTR